MSIFRLYPEPFVSYTSQGQLCQCAVPLPVLDYVSEICLEGLEGCNLVTYFSGQLQFI